MSTADAANAFIHQQQDAATAAQRQRQECWDELCGLFRQPGLDTDALTRVGTIAQVAIDQVFGARHVEAGAAQGVFDQVFDYAECSALYGYALGMADARKQVMHALGVGGVGD
jgi:hypothetical protein